MRWSIFLCLVGLETSAAPRVPVRLLVGDGGPFVHLYRQLDAITVDTVKAAVLADLPEFEKSDLVYLSYFSDENDLRRTATGKLAMGGYVVWKMQFEDYPPTSFPGAQVLVFEKQVSLRVRDSMGGIHVQHYQVVGRQLKPSDTSLWTYKIAGAKFELVELVILGSGGLKAFLKADGLPGKYGEYATAMARELGSKFGASSMQTAVRGDCWFIADQQFPIAYRFLASEKLKPPSKEDFEKSLTAYGSWAADKRVADPKRGARRRFEKNPAIAARYTGR